MTERPLRIGLIGAGDNTRKRHIPGLRAQPNAPVLSERERQVLQAFARGQSIPQVAAELMIGVSTVKTHTQRLYEKLGVSDRAAAVAEAMRRGLLE